ncbi:hypothetical protein HDE_04045 [Halotydeus destructor]|nr:hypothetical protein HDE_04045 [Halotydeus destructor]
MMKVGPCQLRNHVRLVQTFYRYFSQGEVISTECSSSGHQLRPSQSCAKNSCLAGEIVHEEPTKQAHKHEKMFFGSKLLMVDIEKVLNLKNSGGSVFHDDRNLPYLSSLARGNARNLQRIIEAILLYHDNGLDPKQMGRAILKTAKSADFRVKCLKDIGGIMSYHSVKNLKNSLLATEKHLIQLGVIAGKVPLVEVLAGNIADEKAREHVLSKVRDISSPEDSLSVLKTNVVVEYIKLRTNTDDVKLDASEAQFFVLKDAIGIVDIISSDKESQKHAIDWECVFRHLTEDDVRDISTKLQTFLGHHYTFFFRRPFINIFLNGVSEIEKKMNFLCNVLGFTHDQIRRVCANLLPLKLETIKERFSLWSTVFPPEVIVSDKDGLRLISQSELAKYNYENKKKVSLALSLSSLLRTVARGKKNRLPKLRSQDEAVITELCKIYNWNEEVFTKNLRKSPGLCYLDMESCKAVTDFLREEGLDVAKIQDAPYILQFKLFYIRSIFTEYATLVSEWKTSPRACELIVYMILREYDFSDDTEDRLTKPELQGDS